MMENVEIKVDKNKLHITVDLDKELGASKSGKTILIGTTSGACPVPGTNGKAIKVNLNVYRNPEAAKSS